MAVQAQYPSNVLFLNRNLQEGQDYSLQQPPQPGDFLDQTHMLFTNGGANNINNNSNNPRKREREAVSSSVNKNTNIVVAAAAAPMTNNHHFSLQQQPSQLIDLSLLHNNNNNNRRQPPNTSNVVSTGLRLSSGDEQAQNKSNNPRFYNNHKYHQQQHQQQPQQQQQGFLSMLSEDIAAEIKRQRDEFDGFLQTQGEELRRTLAEKRQRQYRALLVAVEEPLARQLREKEAEVAKVTRRREELEARAAQLTAEAQAWQARARAHEAAAASLQVQLQQAMVMSAGGLERDEGLVSGLEARGQGTEDAESAYIDPDRVETVATSAVAAGPTCKACRRRAATVVLLPCRHLCLCPECDRAAMACPLCLALRNSSVEVVLS